MFPPSRRTVHVETSGFAVTPAWICATKSPSARAHQVAPPPPLEAPTVACDATEAVEARPADERALAMAVKKEQLLEVLFGITCGIRVVWCLEDDEHDEELEGDDSCETLGRLSDAVEC